MKYLRANKGLIQTLVILLVLVNVLSAIFTVIQPAPAIIFASVLIILSYLTGNYL